MTETSNKHSNAAINNYDCSLQLAEQITGAYASGTALVIQGGGSKPFLGYPVSGEVVSTSEHQGIISYEPSELTITVRSGTPLSHVKAVLAEKKQMLAFEPPGYSENATIGGVIACGLSGSARPYNGSARDFVLGCRIVNGQGQRLKFGGEVMKNVAGYDLSRLMVGAQGTLGVILDISMKVLPLPEKTLSLKFSMTRSQALEAFHDWIQAGHPISAAALVDTDCIVRLSGSPGSVEQAQQQMGGESIDSKYWQQLDEQQISFFEQSPPLWRISLPPAAAEFDRIADFIQDGKQLINWGGALRWVYSDQSAAVVREQVQACGGHAQLFKSHDSDNNPVAKHHPLQPAVFKLHQRIKASMDPKCILNAGRLYQDL